MSNNPNGKISREFYYIDIGFNQLPNGFFDPAFPEAKGIPVRTSIPAGMKEGLQHLMVTGWAGAEFAQSSLDLFKKLLASERMGPVWAHLDEFSPRNNEWILLIVEALSEPVEARHSRGWREMELAHNLHAYSLIAEKAHELKELLGQPIINGPGFIEDVSEFAEESELDKHLLKLMSMTTSCRWPEVMYRYCYEARTSGVDILEAEDVRNAETYGVRKVNRKKTPQKVPPLDDSLLGGRPELDLLIYGPGNKFTKNAYKPNDAFSEDSNQGPEYTPRADVASHKDVTFTDQGHAPPTFAPPNISLQGGYAMTKGSDHTIFLKEAVYQLVRISYKHGRNLGHIKDKTKSNDSGFWLPARLWSIVLGLACPGYNEENDKIHSYSSTNTAIREAREAAITHIESGINS